MLFIWEFAHTVSDIQLVPTLILNSYDTSVKNNKFHPLCRWIPVKSVKCLCILFMSAWFLEAAINS